MPSAISEKLLPKQNTDGAEISLNNSGIPYDKFGVDQIAEVTLNQMYQEVKLLVAIFGALIPDAHHSYGLPIAGMSATENAIISYGVGVYFGCRLCLSIFNRDAEKITQREAFLIASLNEKR